MTTADYNYPTFEQCQRARPDILWFIDDSDGYGDFPYFDATSDDIDLTGPDSSPQNPYPPNE